VLKTDSDGRDHAVRDVARVEIGSQDYSIRGTSGTRPRRSWPFSSFRVERSGHGRRRSRQPEGGVARFPQGHGIFDPLQPDRICPGFGQ
jgi:hypothetical protein